MKGQGSFFAPQQSYWNESIITAFRPLLSVAGPLAILKGATVGL
jgi:hypothetical protein